MHFLMVLLFSGLARAQGLTPEQQQQLLNEVQQMKSRLNTLENKGSGGGLKKVNYQDQTSDTKSPPDGGQSQGAALSAEDQKKLMQDLETIKAKQADSQKILDKLDKEDEE